ncbi:MAG: universal stress protein [Flavobacteriales bacterium]|jgi:nucleotide-binding universal stress UspA family protein|nr:universal stress protein [Flavobacteriales bacterium]MBT7481364.1 universal stress protein [Flavobacteriales bacterium]
MSTTASKILVPIGFSDQSMIAMGQAMNLAKLKNSEVVLLSVIEENHNMFDLLFNNDDGITQLKEKIIGKLNEIAEEYSEKYGVEVETMVAKGSVYDKVCEVADMVSADLIVMGTNGCPKGITKKFIGSNAEKVVRSSNCPVVTIKGKQHKDGCDNIILPLDLEKETKEKVTYAIEYARYWNSTIRIVSVVLKGNDQVKNHLQRNLQQVHEFITNAGVSCTSELLVGEKKRTLSDVVLDYEKKFESDLIMIMTKKEESLSDSLSVTARSLIFNSEIPVMSIHPKVRKHLTGPTIGF